MQMILQKHTSESGFTLVEVLMTVMLIGILSFVSISYFTEDMNEQRFDATKNEMSSIKEAIIGKEDLLEDSKRVSFGFVGDIGSFPSSLDRLITNGGVFSDYALDATYRIRYGWNGPYLQDESGTNSVLTDAWGNNYGYVTAGDPITLTSYGADGAAGGVGLDQDLVLSIPLSSIRSTVSGVITSGGEPYANNAEVELYAPNGTTGAIQTSTDLLTAVDNGLFSFSNVSYGQRSVRIYIPSKAAPTTIIGPVPISVDKPAYTVATNAIAINSGNFPCTITPDIVYGGAHQFAGGNKNIEVDYIVNSAVTVSAVSINWANERTLSSFTFDGKTFDDCTLPTTEIDICNATKGATLTLTTPEAVLAGTQTMTLAFNASLTTGTPSQSTRPISVLFTHTNGCSLLYFSMP